MQSVPNGPSGMNSPSASSEASRGRAEATADDPNTVVLSRFEDVPLSMPTLSTFPPDRRTSLPDTMQRLEITVSPRGSSLPSSRGDATGPGGRNERLMVHYRGFVAKRIMPLGKHFYLDHGPGYEDPIVAEARSFPPVSPPEKRSARAGRRSRAHTRLRVVLALIFALAISRNMCCVSSQSSSQRSTAVTSRSVSALPPSHLIIFDLPIGSSLGPPPLSPFLAVGL